MDDISTNTTVESGFQHAVSAEDLTVEISLKVIPVTGFILIISILGLFGNVFIILVYTMYYRKSNFRYFVLTLAYIDLLSCVTTLPAEAYAQVNWFTFDSNTLCKTKSFLNVFTIYASALTILFLASDRYRKICHPFLRQIEPQLALRLCVTLVIISGILASPTAVFWGRQTYNVTNLNVTVAVTICEKAGLYADGMYPLAYISSTFVFPVCLSMLFTVFFNIMIARKLVRGVFRISVKKMTCVGCEMDNIPTPEESCLQVNFGSQEHVNEGVARIERQCLRKWRHHSLPAGRWPVKSRCCYLNHFDQNNGSSSSRDTVDVNENGKGIPTIMATIHETNTINSSGTKDHDQESSNTKQSLKHSSKFDEMTQYKSGKKFNNDHTYAQVKSVSLDRPQTPKHRHTIHSSEVDITKADSMTLMGLQQWKLWRQQALKRKALNSRKKTLIMMILSSIFILTILIYFSLVVLVANRNGILRNMSTSKTVLFFFFWRLYFINTVINPILYGLLDERFRKGLRKLCCKRRLYHGRF